MLRLIRLVISIAKNTQTEVTIFRSYNRKYFDESSDKFEYRRGYKFSLCNLGIRQVTTRSIGQQEL